jgi:hypothetical protein
MQAAEEESLVKIELEQVMLLCQLGLGKMRNSKELTVGK